MADVDVLVAGGGVAGLAAAIAARRAGASVLVAEAAPPELRGGNARHGRNLRLMHRGPTELMPGAYDETEFLAEIERVTGGDFDVAVAARLVRASADAPAWLAGCGVAFQRPGGSLPPSRKTAYFLGGGKAVVTAMANEARRIGVETATGIEVVGFPFEGGGTRAVELRRAGAPCVVRARAVVAAAGGAHADRAWLRASFGPVADLFAIRGTPFDTGVVLRALLDAGARPTGGPGRGHLVAVDARGPAVDGGIVTRVEAIPFGLVVDMAGRRFHDEAADFARTHFATWGRLLAERGEAVLILDAEGEARAPIAALPPIRAATLADVAGATGVPATALAETVADFNKRPGGAGKVAVPPFAAYPMRAGLTFTHVGVAVDEAMGVVTTEGGVLSGMFAAGGIMQASVLGRGYLAGLGLTVAVTSGRIAGEAAARACTRA